MPQCYPTKLHEHALTHTHIKIPWQEYFLLCTQSMMRQCCATRLWVLTCSSFVCVTCEQFRLTALLRHWYHTAVRRNCSHVTHTNDTHANTLSMSLSLSRTHKRRLPFVHQVSATDDALRMQVDSDTYTRTTPCQSHRRRIAARQDGFQRSHTHAKSTNTKYAHTSKHAHAHKHTHAHRCTAICVPSQSRWHLEAVARVPSRSWQHQVSQVCLRTFFGYYVMFPHPTHPTHTLHISINVWQLYRHSAVCSSVVQCVAVCCSVLQCVAVCVPSDNWKIFPKSVLHSFYITHLSPFT